MKSTTKLVSAFLLVLFIGPFIFGITYGPVGVPTEPNIVKDFHIAENWYNSSYPYRRSIAISGSSGAGTGYQVRILMSYEADMQSDFDDIIFTDNDGETKLDFWRETYVASSYALFWVKVADDLDSDRFIFTYYGNSTVSSASNGTATFPYLYDDWTIESMRASIWDQDDAAGSVSWSSAGATHGSILKLEGGPVNGRETYTSDDDLAAKFALMFRALIEDTTNLGANTLRVGTSGTVTDAWAYVQSNNGVDDFIVRDSDANDDNQAIDASILDDYFTYQIIRDGTNAYLYVDNVLKETASCSPDVDAGPIAYLQCRDEEYDVYVDWICARKYIDSEPSSGAFGDKETYSSWLPDQWNTVNEVSVYFIIPFHMWGYNTGLIVLGLFMIPASTIYLAHGFKNERSMDRLFFGLIIFTVGWGLLVGGVMP